MEAVLDFLEHHNGDIALDITGGSPEMHPRFRWFIDETDHLSLGRVIRTNLVIAMEPGMEWLPEFYRDHELTLIASLPCVTRENVDAQRGPGVWENSIAVLRRLNTLGYGDELDLFLMYNPSGGSLPGEQSLLEALYREKLMRDFGIRFTRLLTITNVPVGRFQRQLKEEDLLDGYLQVLADEFNPTAARNMMCRSLISVGWTGALFNCDFNLASGLPLKDDHGGTSSIYDLPALLKQGFSPVFGEHCFACTAGCGSGCFGQAEASKERLTCGGL
jgi:radical SAM/Cys-rich protein